MVVERGWDVGEGGEGGCGRGRRGTAWPSGRHWTESAGQGRRMGAWDVRAETRKSRTRNIRGLISPEDRVLYCHQPSSKLCENVRQNNNYFTLSRSTVTQELADTQALTFSFGSSTLPTPMISQQRPLGRYIHIRKVSFTVRLTITSPPLAASRADKSPIVGWGSFCAQLAVDSYSIRPSADVDAACVVCVRYIT